MKKYLTRSKSKSQRSLPHFHPIVSIITLFVGILGTIFVTHVLAQVASTTIYACVNNSTGILRIVSSTTICRNNETLLTWNQQGIQGPPGPAGSGGESPLGVFMCPGCLFFGDEPSLAGKDFTGADLNNSQFGNDLSNTIFTNAFMSNVNMSANLLDNASFQNVTTINMRFGNPGSSTTGTNTNFSHMHGTNGQQGNLQILLHDVTLHNANFQNANISITVEDDFVGRAHNTDLSGSNFSNAHLANSNFIDENYSNTHWVNADLSTGTQPASFDHTNLSNADFTGANLKGVTGLGTTTITGVTWSNTTCPDGTNSDNNGNTCIGHM